MQARVISRRTFAGLLGAGVAGTLDWRGASTAAAAAGRDRQVPAAPGSERLPLARLDSNEFPDGPSARARAAIGVAGDEFCRYPDLAEARMREAIARHHGMESSQVALGCGSTEILKMAAQAFLSPGRTLVAAEPTFEAVLESSRLAQAEAVKVPLTAAHAHDLDAMAAACTERAGLVYVCNPNNPTGTVVSGRPLEAFLRRLPPWTMVVVDEAYAHFVVDPSYTTAVDLLPRFANLVVVRTFSKIYGMAGLRLGYAMASEPVIAALRRHAVASNANAAVLAAARATLGEPGLVAERRAAVVEARRRLYAELERDRRSYIPSEANFVMIRIGADVGPLVEQFKARGLWVGRRFAAMPDYLRVSIGTPAEMTLFVDTLRQLVPVRA
jgi:histidinol-phosphate aminotransferase